MVRDNIRHGLGCMVCILVILAGCNLAPPDTDEDGQGSSNAPANNRPSADAGEDLWVLADEAGSVALDGSRSHVGDGHTLTYKWYCSHEAAFFTPNDRVADPTVNLPGSGVYILMLVVDDGILPSEPDFITITVGNGTGQDPPPVAEAGADQTVPANEAGRIPLDGNGSYDADGHTLTYQWYCSHDSAAFSPDNQTAAPTLSLPGPGVYVIILVVNDGSQPSAPDFLTVTVEPSDPLITSPPVAEAGPDQTVLVSEVDHVFLDGSQSYDPEGDALSYQWHCSNASAIFSEGADVSQPTVSLPGPGIYVFALVVKDGLLASDPDFLTITVKSPDAWVDSTLAQDLPEEKRYRTIKAAIDEIADGTDRLIAIDNGPYDEQVIVANGVRLYGMRQADGFRARPLIRYAVAENEAVIVLNDNTGLECLYIASEAGSGDSSLKSAVLVQGTGVKISRCRIEDSQSDGVQLTVQSEIEIRNTVLERIPGEGIVANAGSSLQVFDTRIIDTGGSAVWAVDASDVVIENTVIHLTGWHGVDIQGCEFVSVNHCSIIDFSDNNSGQAGVIITNCVEVGVTNNLIVIQDLATLIGVQLTTGSEAASPQFIYNYIYSIQNSPNYYAGELDLSTVDESNWPNAAEPVTEDPLLMDPVAGDFRLQANSPASGVAQDSDNCGAQGAVLVNFSDY